MKNEEKETNMRNKKHRRIVKNAMQESVILHNQLEASKRTMEFFAQMATSYMESGRKISDRESATMLNRAKYETRLFSELQARFNQLEKIVNGKNE